VSKTQRKKFEEEYFQRIFTALGDAVKGEKLLYRCRKVEPSKKPVADTGGHRASEGKLTGTAVCGIIHVWHALQQPPTGQGQYTDQA
jgi:hypothetical protein